MSERFELRFVQPDTDLHQAERTLRHEVLRRPLGFAPGSELFAFERDCLHLVALVAGRLVGCVLFHPESPSTGRLLQMAVAPDRQRKGIGEGLVRTMEAELAARGFHSIHLHAREKAVPFYRRLGYRAFGEPYLELGIRHVNMRRELGGAVPVPEEVG